MQFSEAIQTVKTVLESIGSNISGQEYDGLIVKKLEASNTLDEGRATNQTHIAITGSQMDIFPYIRADGYFDVSYANKDDDLKKFFVAQIPVYLHKENILYLDSDAQIFTENNRLVYVSIVRSRRNDASDQIQMSMTNIDSPAYVSYRKLVHAKSYMILLKRKEELVYDLYSVKESDGDSSLNALNNGFFKLQTNTPVKLDKLTDKQQDRDPEELPFSVSQESARRIIETIYELDGFDKLRSVLQLNNKFIKIRDEVIGGRYLRAIFARPSAAAYNERPGEKSRAFQDKEYVFHIDGETEKCTGKLSKEWVSVSLDSSESVGDGGNYLLALINLVNKYYSDSLRIFEDSGKWFLERLKKKFSLTGLPEIMNSRFSRRFITSLLAKPFVILTGNSGTGKTRIAKQFAEYLEVRDSHGEKNWMIVPVGADWTDNSRIMGFYNPLANNGKGQYEKTGIIRMIERANEDANRNLPYFLILDEMNLSHVERYFSDFLSHMEIPDSDFEIDGYRKEAADGKQGNANIGSTDVVTGKLPFPKNLFVVGTVNIDETTYMFSPKVLDRANVIEFKPDEKDVLDVFTMSGKETKIIPAGNGNAEAFLRLATEIRSGENNIDSEQMQIIADTFRTIYRFTEKKGFEFAFRTVNEIRKYIEAASRLSETWNTDEVIRAIDEQLLQKVLPKIHGNKKEIEDMLDQLLAVCKTEGKELKLSEEKINQMKRRLAAVQYASFI